MNSPTFLVRMRPHTKEFPGYKPTVLPRFMRGVTSAGIRHLRSPLIALDVVPISGQTPCWRVVTLYVEPLRERWDAGQSQNKGATFSNERAPSIFIKDISVAYVIS